jgi:myo-inositol 2-dehydrogenase/D-chiro-inositol 1-dehydrogenase
MPQLPRVAVAGIGRMGQIHALHLHELAQEGKCIVAALVDSHPDRAREFAASLGVNAPILQSVDELASSGLADATVLVTPTDKHRENATALIAAGQRVLSEKPLTGTLEGDTAFAAELDRHHPDSLMLAFQRRFDPPLAYAKQLMDSGDIGRVFKIFTSLEDSTPAPNGYRSGGILSDMSVHNVDEVLWLTGEMPVAAAAIGARIYSHRHTTAIEDFDDALLYLWFRDRLVSQIQVGRNHVSGYRVESIIFGEEGQIHVGRFDQKLFDITVEAYGRRGSRAPIAHRVFPMRNYGRPLPEFIDRFGEAYKAEVAAFIHCCASQKPFPITHRDGLRAQQVITMGMNSIIQPQA